MRSSKAIVENSILLIADIDNYLKVLGEEFDIQELEKEIQIMNLTLMRLKNINQFIESDIL